MEKVVSTWPTEESFPLVRVGKSPQQLSFELDPGVSSRDIPSRDVINSYTFCWMARASEAERERPCLNYVRVPRGLFPIFLLHLVTHSERLQERTLPSCP